MTWNAMLFSGVKTTNPRGLFSLLNDRQRKRALQFK
jgi:hypothetical protein